MRITGCEVCWKCRGLVPGYSTKSSALKDHVSTCTGELNEDAFFNFIVCDKTDYLAMMCLKKNLSLHYQSLMKFAKNFPNELIRSISQICDISGENNANGNNAEHNIDQLSTDFDSQNNANNILTVVQLGKDVPNENLLENEINDDNGCENIADNVLSSHNEMVCTEEISENVLISANSSILSKEQRDKLRNECVVTTEGVRTSYCCKLCNKVHKSELHMIRHLKTHNDGQPFQCDKCEYSTIWRSYWNQHENKCVHQNYFCHICGLEVYGKSKLVKHLGVCTGKNKQYKCKDCDYVGSNFTSLRDHEKKHSGEMLYCPHENCSFKSFYKKSLNKHLNEKHAVEKTHICSLCGFTTRHLGSLKKHALLHEMTKKFKCVKCSFTSYTAGQVQEHARKIHLKEKPYACPHCPYRTNWPTAIVKHVQGHMGYNCPICQESNFSSVAKVKQHIAKAHGRYGKDLPAPQKTNLSNIKPSHYLVRGQMIDDQVQKDQTMDYVVMVTEDDNKTLDFANSKTLDLSAAEVAMDLNPSDVLELATDIINRESGEVVSNSQQPLVAPSMQTETEALVHVGDMFDSQTSSHKGGNPLLSASSNDLGDSAHKGGNPMLSATSNEMLGDGEHSLDSLFDLMTDFPKPSNLNRCQSASTLMFTSFSPSFSVDRPLTPDFGGIFSDSPSAGSFFPNFTTKSMEQESLPLGQLNSYDSGEHHVQRQLPLHKSMNSASPVIPKYMPSPLVQSTKAFHPLVNITDALMQSSSCDTLDNVLHNTLFSNRSSNSAFTAVSEQYSRDVQNAVASITENQSDHTAPNNESPFPQGI